jgi:hypothetical protein
VDAAGLTSKNGFRLERSIFAKFEAASAGAKIEAALSELREESNVGEIEDSAGASLAAGEVLGGAAMGGAAGALEPLVGFFSQGSTRSESEGSVVVISFGGAAGVTAFDFEAPREGAA